MAATAGSVAVGSTIGHGLSSMLFGGSSHAAPAPEAQAVPVQQQQQSTYQAQGVTCETQAKGAFGHHSWLSARTSCVHPDFTKCLEKADLQSCSWYLEQLKAVRTVILAMLLYCNVDIIFLSAKLLPLPTRVSLVACPTMFSSHNPQ